MPRIMFFRRPEYLRVVAYAFVAGFFGHVVLQHSTSPQFQRWVEVAVVIIGLIAAFTGSRSRRKKPLERP
jgi:uncharacterized membrane protein YfcA